MVFSWRRSRSRRARQPRHRFGETFAYLVPALLAGGKVIISTGTKTLQDQLYDRDLPAVREALACGTTAALLKGRANYVCLYRMKRAASEGRLASREEASQLRRIERFAAITTTGDRADLARDARLELRAAGGASPELDRVATRLDKAARDLRLALGEPGARLAWMQALRLPDFPGALEKLQISLKELEQPLAEQAERSEGLASCARRAGGAVAVLARMRESEGQAEVRWVEVYGHAAQLHVTPLSSAELFRRQVMDHPRAWIFTSATLAVGEDFRHFTRELGVPDAETRSWASPFDFARQALLYVPKGLPLDPNDPAFTQAVIEAALPVLKASGGRAFLLFTTLRALRRAHELLRSRIGFPLLVQGTGSRRGRQPFHGAAIAASGAAAQARRRALDPRRDRPRHPDALRSAPGGAPVRAAHPAQPAAHETYAPPCGRRGLLPRLHRRRAGRAGLITSPDPRSATRGRSCGGRRVSGSGCRESWYASRGPRRPAGRSCRANRRRGRGCTPLPRSPAPGGSCGSRTARGWQRRGRRRASCNTALRALRARRAR